MVEITLTPEFVDREISLSPEFEPQELTSPAGIETVVYEGGGGVTDYDDLTGKPSIEGVTLSGNKTAAQLGLAKATDIPTVPVQSVNGKTGAVVLDAEDVGALPDDTPIPSKTSELTNDSGFVNASGAASAAPVQSVNGKTGAVVLAASDVGAGTYSKPSGGIPKTDLSEAVGISLSKADSAYQKPSGGIPAADLASGVIPTVPTNVSAFTNDAGYLTLATLPVYSGGVS